MIEIRRATRDDECTIAAMLTQAKALSEHPMCAAAKQGAKSGASPLGLVLAIDRMIVGACLRAGCTCLIAEDDGTPAAVAVLECPGEEALTLRNLLRSGAKRLTRFIKPGAFPGGMRAVSSGARCAQQEMRVIDIAVDELWQGQGLTHMLIEHAVDEARARGLKRLTVTACVPGERERYEQMGFAASDARTLELWGVSMPEQDMSLMLCEDEAESAPTAALLEGAESAACEDEISSEVCECEADSEACDAYAEDEACKCESDSEACDAYAEDEACECEADSEVCDADAEDKACKCESEDEACKCEVDSEACDADAEDEACECEVDSEACDAYAEDEACECEADSEACDAYAENEACECESNSEACDTESDSEASEPKAECAAPEHNSSPTVICIDEDEIDLGMNAWRKDDEKRM